MPRALLFAAVALTALAAAACSSRDSGEVISREQFVEAYVELRAISQRYMDDDVPLAERDRVLQELGLTPEDLLDFVDVHGADATFMHEVWEEVDTRFREIRSRPPVPAQVDPSLPPGTDPSFPSGGDPSRPPGGGSPGSTGPDPSGRPAGG
jgi:hypothetical protein